jgi:hypothetical protein
MKKRDSLVEGVILCININYLRNLSDKNASIGHNLNSFFRKASSLACKPQTQSRRDEYQYQYSRSREMSLSRSPEPERFRMMYPEPESMNFYRTRRGTEFSVYTERFPEQLRPNMMPPVKFLLTFWLIFCL